jgi:hypothetical protein
VPDPRANERFLDDDLVRLKGVAPTRATFALGRIKRSNVLPI